MEVPLLNLDPYILSSRSCVVGKKKKIHTFHTTCHISEFCMKLETDIYDNESGLQKAQISKTETDTAKSDADRKSCEVHRKRLSLQGNFKLIHECALLHFSHITHRKSVPKIRKLYLRNCSATGINKVGFEQS